MLSACLVPETAVGSPLPVASVHVAWSVEHRHSPHALRAAVDFVYGLGGLVDIDDHATVSADSNQVVLGYALGKPRMWPAHFVDVHDWRVRLGRSGLRYGRLIGTSRAGRDGCLYAANDGGP